MEDGLIAMYIEHNAKDYIDTMMLDAPPPVADRSGKPRRVSVPDEQERKETVRNDIGKKMS